MASQNDSSIPPAAEISFDRQSLPATYYAHWQAFPRVVTSRMLDESTNRTPEIFKLHVSFRRSSTILDICTPLPNCIILLF